MPQISSTDLLRKHKIPFTLTWIQLGSLSYIQEDFDQDKIDAISNQIQMLDLTPDQMPYLFYCHGTDPVVLDGNHRAKAYLQIWGPLHIIPAFRVDMHIMQAIERIKNLSESILVERIGPAQFAKIEKRLDQLFAAIGVDVTITKHFQDRVNQRNIPVNDFAQTLQKFFQKYKMKITDWGTDVQKILKSIVTDINIPFVITTNKKGELELVLKTIMKKKDFKSSTPFVFVESLTKFNIMNFLKLVEELIPKLGGVGEFHGDARNNLFSLHTPNDVSNDVIKHIKSKGWQVIKTKDFLSDQIYLVQKDEIVAELEVSKPKTFSKDYRIQLRAEKS